MAQPLLEPVLVSPLALEVPPASLDAPDDEPSPLLPLALPELVPLLDVPPPDDEDDDPDVPPEPPEPEPEADPLLDPPLDPPLEPPLLDPVLASLPDPPLLEPLLDPLITCPIAGLSGAVSA
jgi:hypothetical protein